MKRLYSFETRVGTFYIVTNGRFYYPEFEGQTYGAYNSVSGLLSDLIGGHTFSFPRGIDPTKLNIPEDITEWERLKLVS